jgi:hypothetical protein
LSVDWAGIAGDLLGVLQELGQSVVLSRTSASAPYNADTSTADPITESAARTAAVLGFSGGQTTVRGTLVRANDRRCIMDASGPAPTTDDQITVAGDSYSVVSVDGIAPGGVALAYDIHLRAN